MVRRLALPLLLVTVLPVQSGAGTRGKHPRVTALVCAVGYNDKGAADRVTVIGGVFAGRWVGSEKAQGLLRKGDRLSVYDPATGRSGVATLTNGGRLLSEAEDEPGSGQGLEFGAAVQVAQPPQADEATGETTVFATYTRHGPPPHWVKPQVLATPAKGSPYWMIAEDWLRAHRASPRAVAHLEFEQAVRGDINCDGRDEVLLSFHGSEGQSVGDLWKDKYYSYLLMRRIGPSGRADTLLLDDDDWPQWRMSASGFCDLDGDGWAEIVVEGGGVDASETDLYHWNGHRFVKLDGFGWGY